MSSSSPIILLLENPSLPVLGRRASVGAFCVCSTTNPRSTAIYAIDLNPQWRSTYIYMHTFCSQLLTGWGNNYRRRLRVFTLALVIYLDYKAVVKRVHWFSKHHEDALWESAHNRNARRIVKFMIEMKGLWVKLGQYMSTRADILPEAYRCLFVQLQDSLPPRALKEVTFPCKCFVNH
ncbi:hypothetical protein ZIOFF_003508 [Zingiber officinale]|uniref:Uncharacterized protein n=1 Tax=Zingiber officinale TaxID=94328 RepID=A0A8J5IDF0_ZINOF|nr:hypothetical protein ZIOFF_003508 [Zingiber officinale]